MNADQLETAEGKLWLLEEYIHKERSPYQIAAELDTYPNRIRRALLKHKIPVRDHREAQKLALATGRNKHPTKGIEREEEVRGRIGTRLKNRRKET